MLGYGGEAPFLGVWGGAPVGCRAKPCYVQCCRRLRELEGRALGGYGGKAPYLRGVWGRSPHVRSVRAKPAPRERSQGVAFQGADTFDIYGITIYFGQRGVWGACTPRIVILVPSVARLGASAASVHILRFTFRNPIINIGSKQGL